MNDKDIVLVALTRKGRNLKFALTFLQNDKQIVIAALTNNNNNNNDWYFKYAFKSLQNNKEIAL